MKEIEDKIRGLQDRTQNLENERQSLIIEIEDLIESLTVNKNKLIKTPIKEKTKIVECGTTHHDHTTWYGQNVVR